MVTAAMAADVTPTPVKTAVADGTIAIVVVASADTAEVAVPDKAVVTAIETGTTEVTASDGTAETGTVEVAIAADGTADAVAGTGIAEDIVGVTGDSGAANAAGAGNADNDAGAG